MRFLYINPNSTRAMTESIVAVARAACPDADIRGLTNAAGPPAIEGPEAGAAAIEGLLELVQAEAGDADAVVIACFDDTGLAEARSAAPCPVLGIGQSSYVMAGLLGLRFSVVTSLEVALPVIQGNIVSGGFEDNCAGLRASGLPVLKIDAGGEEVLGRIAAEIDRARTEDGAGAAILGCAGMSPLAGALAARSSLRIIDGVAASARLAVAAAAETR